MMKAQVRIALVGDYNPQAVAHQAIPWRSGSPPPISTSTCSPSGYRPKP